MLSGEHKKTILELRKRIRKVIPRAEETMKYGMPTFIVNGNAVAGLMSHKKHIGFYPYSGAILKNFPAISNKYATTKGALHVPLGTSMTHTEIRLLIKARLALCPVTRGEIDLSKYEALDGEWRKLGIAAPARRGLVDNKLTRISQLRRWHEKDVKKIHAMGPTALALIKREMKKKGITFK